MASGQYRINVVPAARIYPAAAFNESTFIFTPTPEDLAAASALPQNTGPFATPANLLAADRPTAMTVWELTNLYLPASINATTTALGAAPVIGLMLQLVLNDEVVWQESESVGLNNMGGGVSWGIGEIDFSADLNNAITVQRGDRLALRMIGSTPQITTLGFTGITVGLGAVFSYDGVTPLWRPRNGAIGYSVRQLAGARGL